MAIRTPLTQERSQYHHYWGIFDPTNIGGILPAGTVAGLGLPNTDSANIDPADGTPIAVTPNLNTENESLEVGDIAYSLSNNCMYVCVDAGTIGGGDAVWECMNAPVSTRDAHQIVVGIDDSAKGGLDTILTDASDVDFLDVGDGVELAAALAAADVIRTNLRYAPDVRIRAGQIAMVNNAFTVPVGVRLIGAGANITSEVTAEKNTVITAAAGAGVAVLSQNAILEEITLISAGDFASTVELAVEGGQQIERVRFEVSADNSVAHSAIRGAAALATSGGNVLVNDCFFQFSDVVGTNRCAAIELEGTPSVRNNLQVKNCRQVGGHTGVFATNMSEASVSDYSIMDANGTLNIGHAFDFVYSAAGSYSGPELRDVRVKYADALPASAGARVASVRAEAGALVDGLAIQGVRAEAPAAPAGPLGPVVFITTGDDPSRISRGVVEDIAVNGDLASLAGFDNTFIYVQNAAAAANSPGAGISNIRISEVHFTSDPNAGKGAGVLFESTAIGALISNCSVMNSTLPGDWNAAVLGITSAPVIATCAQAGDISGLQVGFNVLGLSNGGNPLPAIRQGSMAASNVEAGHNITSALI